MSGCVLLTTAFSSMNNIIYALFCLFRVFQKACSPCLSTPNALHIFCGSWTCCQLVVFSICPAESRCTRPTSHLHHYHTHGDTYLPPPTRPTRHTRVRYKVQTDVQLVPCARTNASTATSNPNPSENSRLDFWLSTSYSGQGDF